MPHGSDDARKQFVLTTTGNYFGLKPSASLVESEELNNFLDDGNEFVLAVNKHENDLCLSNKIEAGYSREKVLVFFKLRPTVITEENLHQNVLVSSMLESPISTLYQAVRQVFAPMLLKDERWSSAFDPKLAGLLSELEQGLGSVVRRAGTEDSGKRSPGEDDILGILTPVDEFQYWADLSESGDRSTVRERAAHFSELFKPIEKDYSGLDGVCLADAVELVEVSRDTLDDVWRQNDHDPFPETRMLRLMDVIGGALGRYVQKKLSGVKLFLDPFLSVRESLRVGLVICEQWVSACEHLSGQVWKRYAPYPWKGDKHRPQALHSLAQRLDEVVTIRTVHEKLLRLLPGGKQQALASARVFEPFSGLNPLHYNPYTEPLWRAAVAQFERAIAPAEQEVAGRLKAYIADVQDNPQQLLQVFQKHKELIRRPNVSKELQSERETLLARLLEYIKVLRTDFEGRCHGAPGEKSGPLAGRNLPEVVNNIVWVRQLLHKVEDSIKIAQALLSDLSGFRLFLRFCDDLLEILRAYEQEQFDDWSRDILSGLSDPKSGISLQASNRVMELDHIDGKLKIQYSDRLVTLLREVRQLSALGFPIPAKIQQAANTADKFYRQAIILKQVAHFYNTIDQQMISSQRPMMLSYALAFEQVIKNPRSQPRDSGGKLQITWDNPKELEVYIGKLQSAAERLSTENRKLRKWHTDFTEKVVALMTVDLLRHQQRWKDGLQELRTGVATLEAQGFRSGEMKAWRQHWNHQLYKALEHQYQTGLEALNKNLPEIHIDLTFKQGRLQFRPPFEEVRAKYFREMKRFISIPNQFKGVSAQGEELIFSVMIDRNASGFLTIFRKAEDLFSRLLGVQDKFKEWVVLGQVDMDVLVEKQLSSVQDWERNFKALKARGKESERLPSLEKVDCITVNCEPVKAVIDDLIQRLFDTLLMSLRKSIQGHTLDIDSFVTGAMETLSSRPESIDEIGEANARHSQIQARKPDILLQFQAAQEKNRLLRAVAGGGLDSLSSLRAKWDKLEMMMESHQLMIKEQVEVMRSNAESRVQAYRLELDRFRARWDQLKPRDEVIETGDQAALLASVQTIRDKRQEFQELEVTRTRLLEDCRHFELEAPDFSLAEETIRDMEEYGQMWSLYEDWQEGFQEKAKEDWITFRSKTYVFEEFLFAWQDRLRKLEQHTSMSVKLQREVDKYKVREGGGERRDNRVTSLSSRAGIRNSLITILDQLQRCQKSLNEFLEMKKALELCEQLRQRMGVVIVGPSGAGKSTLWRMLRAALGRTGRVVKQYTVNPKAMPRQQLLGHIDMDTREWTDGVLTNSARQVVREPQGKNHDQETTTTQPYLFAIESPPDPRKPLDTYFDPESGRLCVYTLERPDGLSLEELTHTHTLPVIQTPDMQRGLHCFSHWLSSQHRQPFILVGPEGCGKGMLLRYAFSRLRSTQVAVVHCSAQTSSRHVLQKLSQTCLLLSSNTGRAYRPKHCENLVLYLKDINLPKPDKWGTSNLIAFLQQVLTYHGFYDENLDWVGLENVQVVASMSTGGAVGRHTLTSRFTSIVRICTIDYPDREQLQTIYSAYLQPVLQRSLGSQAAWASTGKTHQLAGSLVQVYEQVYSVLEVVAYEAKRLFRDRLVSSKDIHSFDNILSSVIRGDWGSDALDNMTDGFYVTWGASEGGGVMAPGQSLPPHGKSLGRLDFADLRQVIHKGAVLYGRDNRELDLLLFWEVCHFVSRVDRVLSRPGGSLLLAGRSGVGRRTATCLVSHMHGYTLYTPKISRGYSLKHFNNDLKNVMQLAGLEGQQVVLLLEDYQFVHPAFLEMVNSLLSSGEVPGLYSPEELEPLLSSLKDPASQDGFTGPLFNYFAYRIQQNLHIVLIMDCTNSNFTISCESNPALYRRCSVQWMEGWSESSMKKIPEMLLAKVEGEEEKSGGEKASGQGDLCRSFLMIHESCREYGATPSQYMTFLHVYTSIYSSKQSQLTLRQQHLQNAKRASAAAAPLAAWLKANVQYSHVLERIQPLEREQAGLLENLRKTESRKTKLEEQLNSVGQKVDEITEELDTLPKRAMLAAAFITYLSAAPEDRRRTSLETWMKASGLQKFDLRHFLCSESEQLIWKSEGLPSDDLSMENALVILQSVACPFLIDPSSRATEWLRTHLKQHRLEVINQQTLATAQGNILENKELIDSLNQTKSSSALIQDSLRESHRLQASLDQEWDAFTGLVVGDMVRKADTQKSLQEQIPSWIDQERLGAVAMFKSTFPGLYQSLCLSDSDLWLSFSRSSNCEQEVPPSIAKKIKPFQQVLLVQAIRPDRLQSAMAAFTSQALGECEELSPPPLNLRRLYSETLEIEPVLIIISPGADPSQELLELASETVGRDNYHEVAMGQGQADVALATLRECSHSGGWLCLKNLHLVTAWLPLLEKELNVLQPKAGFRLWLTAEVHPKFPLILLQSSLKITFEDYRGVIENLPEDDRPAFFGLPANIERSSQRIISSQVISQLRILSRSVAAGSKFDREIWSNGLSPVLNLWKKLNQFPLCKQAYFMLIIPREPLMSLCRVPSAQCVCL
uniref:Dynein cytoplasmic 2 heavy chain 1 n=1 Tax=Oncorhynchus kisutch TaxID=8019 RepID=A0A8C7E017_ONCKI